MAVKQLAEDFARYLYLPRLRDGDVLAEAISEGLGLVSWAQDSFAYADAWDDQNQRYRGLQVGPQINVNIEGDGLLIKPEIAAPQIAEEQKRDERREREQIETPPKQPEVPRPRRYHGSVSLDPLRLGRDAAAVADEIVQHLTKQPGAKVEVTLEIQAQIPNGAPDDLVLTVSENSRTLKFTSFDFEES